MKNSKKFLRIIKDLTNRFFSEEPINLDQLEALSIDGHISIEEKKQAIFFRVKKSYSEIERFQYSGLNFIVLTMTRREIWENVVNFLYTEYAFLSQEKKKSLKDDELTEIIKKYPWGEGNLDKKPETATRGLYVLHTDQKGNHRAFGYQWGFYDVADRKLAKAFNLQKPQNLREGDILIVLE